MGIPREIRKVPEIRGFWIRKDWLEQHGLPVPKTFAEVENVAREFVAKNPGKAKKGNYGINLNKDLAQMIDLEPAFGAKTGGWVDVDGKLEYERIQPQIKDQWKKFAEWYKAGILAKDFTIKTEDNEIKQDFLTGKFGIYEGGPDAANGGTIKDWKKTDPKREVVFVPMTTVDGSNPFYYVQPSYGNVVLVNKNFEHPKAAMKILNFGTSIWNEPKPDFIKDTSEKYLLYNGSMSASCEQHSNQIEKPQDRQRICE